MYSRKNLCSYATNLFKLILPNATDLDVTINRKNCLSKPSYLPEQTPRDVIVCLHFFHIKELMLASRNKSQIPSQCSDLQFYISIYASEEEKPQYHNKISLQS